MNPTPASQMDASAVMLDRIDEVLNLPDNTGKGLALTGKGYCLLYRIRTDLAAMLAATPPNPPGGGLSEAIDWKAEYEDEAERSQMLDDLCVSNARYLFRTMHPGKSDDEIEYEQSEEVTAEAVRRLTPTSANEAAGVDAEFEEREGDDDEVAEFYVNGVCVASLNHDQHGWEGIHAGRKMFENIRAALHPQAGERK